MPARVVAEHDERNAGRSLADGAQDLQAWSPLPLDVEHHHIGEGGRMPSMDP